MGFITADVEYITNTSSKYSFPLDDNGNPVNDNGYFDGVNSVIKSFYKNTFSFRLVESIKWMNWHSVWVDLIQIDPYSFLNIERQSGDGGWSIG